MNLPKRDLTRKQRAAKKEANATYMPVSVAIINFGSDGNVAFTIRACACFGAKNLYVIGNTNLSRATLNDLSGSTYDFISIKTFRDPVEFISFTKENGIKLVAMELTEDASLLKDYRFDFETEKEHCIVVGSETVGVPVEILKNADVVEVPMNGVSFCMNTSQTANVALYVASMQYMDYETEKCLYEATQKFGW